jgi:hypothetical protein
MGAFAVNRGVLVCPGDLEIAGLAVVLAFLAAAGFAPHGLQDTHADQLNADLLAFLRS